MPTQGEFALVGCVVSQGGQPGVGGATIQGSSLLHLLKCTTPHNTTPHHTTPNCPEHHPTPIPDTMYPSHRHTPCSSAVWLAAPALGPTAVHCPQGLPGVTHAPNSIRSWQGSSPPAVCAETAPSPMDVDAATTTYSMGGTHQHILIITYATPCKVRALCRSAWPMLAHITPTLLDLDMHGWDKAGRWSSPDATVFDRDMPCTSTCWRMVMHTIPHCTPPTNTQVHTTRRTNRGAYTSTTGT
jgi:hypothetical protein